MRLYFATGRFSAKMYICYPGFITKRDCVKQEMLNRNMQDQDKELSLVIPCYNSNKSLATELPLIVSFLKENHVLHEIIVVDDGSIDGNDTASIAKQNSCIYVRQPENTGKGAALRLGFAKATGRIRVFTDSDFPFDPTAILETKRIIESGSADIVIGDRTNPASQYYLNVSLVRKFGSFLISGIGKMLLRNNIVDTQCGIKGFSPEAANILFPTTVTNRFGIDFELLLLASRMNMRITKIPVVLRTSYPSSVKVMRDGIRIIQEIYRAKQHHDRSEKRR